MAANTVPGCSGLNEPRGTVGVLASAAGGRQREATASRSSHAAVLSIDVQCTTGCTAVAASITPECTAAAAAAAVGRRRRCWRWRPRLMRSPITCLCLPGVELTSKRLWRQRRRHPGAGLAETRGELPLPLLERSQPGAPTLVRAGGAGGAHETEGLGFFW